jgi:hypothetical protein
MRWPQLTHNANQVRASFSATCVSLRLSRRAFENRLGALPRVWLVTARGVLLFLHRRVPRFGMWALLSFQEADSVAFHGSYVFTERWLVGFTPPFAPDEP